MGYSSKRNEYNANFSKEHYVRTNAKMTSEDHLKVTKIARSNDLSNSELIKLGLKLLDKGELQTFVEEAKEGLHQRSKGGETKIIKSFAIIFKNEEAEDIAYQVKEKYQLSYGIIAKATALYLEKENTNQ